VLDVRPHDSFNWTIRVRYVPGWLARLFGAKPHERTWIGGSRCFYDVETGRRPGWDHETWLGDVLAGHKARAAYRAGSQLRPTQGAKRPR
jgi:hypothetical protein